MFIRHKNVGTTPPPAGAQVIGRSCSFLGHSVSRELHWEWGLSRGERPPPTMPAGARARAHSGAGILSMQIKDEVSHRKFSQEATGKPAHSNADTHTLAPSCLCPWCCHTAAHTHLLFPPHFDHPFQRPGFLPISDYPVPVYPHLVQQAPTYSTGIGGMQWEGLL